MLFNSYEFIFLFLPFTFLVYFFLLGKRLATGAKGFLVFASLFFYSWWNIAYLPLILGSILFNYVVGNTLSTRSGRERVPGKAILAFGIVCNIAVLGYFKYADFFIENVDLVFGTSTGLLQLALPLAISFFTFQQIAYLVDSYRARTREYDFLNYAIFVTFFPQLIAGPIVHHAEMMPQFASRWNLVKNYRNIAAGLFIFSIGLFKKVVIADTFSVWAGTGFDVAVTLNFLEAWATSLSYTLQLYFDFSGYTDMAIGAALLFNIRLPVNFNSPYKARDIQDFWRRWHITLSRFLRDYIYIPLGGNRKGALSTYNNILVTFILGGLWNGAGWTFVFWGFLHGAAVVVHRAWKQLGFSMPGCLAWFITFNFVNVTWVFFRANEWKDAIKVLRGMAGAAGISLYYKLEDSLAFLRDYNLSFGDVFANIEGSNRTVTWLIVCLLLVFIPANSNELKNRLALTNLNVLFTVVLFVVSIFSMTRLSEFLYFNF
jgi:alginate O-acetyltransferase complex protein AlgI